MYNSALKERINFLYENSTIRWVLGILVLWLVCISLQIMVSILLLSSVTFLLGCLVIHLLMQGGHGVIMMMFRAMRVIMANLKHRYVLLRLRPVPLVISTLWFLIFAFSFVKPKTSRD